MAKMKSLDQFAQEGLSLSKENLENVNGGIWDQATVQSYTQDTLQPTSDCLLCSRGDRLGYLTDGETFECVYI